MVGSTRLTYVWVVAARVAVWVGAAVTVDCLMMSVCTRLAFTMVTGYACVTVIDAAAEASATSSLGVDHASKLSAIPAQAEVDALVEAAVRHLREAAKRLGDKVRMGCMH